MCSCFTHILNVLYAMPDRSLNASFSGPLPTAPVCPGAVGQQLFVGGGPDTAGAMPGCKYFGT